MKNKKLFAILTLVCFMFTLMPVAAFAAPTSINLVGNEDGTVTITTDEATEVHYQNGNTWVTDDIATVAGESNATYVLSAEEVVALGTKTLYLPGGAAFEALTTAMVAAAEKAVSVADFNDKVSVNASVFATVDADAEISKNETADAAITLKTASNGRIVAPIGGQVVYVWAEAKTNQVSDAFVVAVDDDDNAAVARASVKGVWAVTVPEGESVADLDLSFLRAATYTLYASFNEPTLVDVSELDLPEFEGAAASYTTVKVNNTVTETEFWGVAVENEDSDVDILVDGEETAKNFVVVNANGVKDTTITLTVLAGQENGNTGVSTLKDATSFVDAQVVAGYPVALDTNSSNIEISTTSATSNHNGEVKFDVAGLREGVYKVYVTVGDVEVTVYIQVGASIANDIEVIEAPEAPIAKDTKIDEYKELIQFEVTDVNGNVVNSADIGNCTANNPNKTDDAAAYVTILEQPAASKIADHDIWVELAGDHYVLATDGKNFDCEGTYSVKVILDNGRSAVVTWEVKKFQTPVEIVIDAPKTVELGTNFDVELTYVDANGVEKLAKKDADITATGYAIANFDDNNDGTADVEVKSDEKYAGSVITLTAVSERYNLVATQEVKVAAEAVAIEFENDTLAVNVNNKVAWNVVDEEGNAVTLNPQVIAETVIKYVVLDAPADAKVSVYDATDKPFDGDGEMALTSNKVGNVTVQVIAQVKFGTTGQDSTVAEQTKYYTGVQIFAVGTEGVGDVVVMSIGSNEIVINDAKATIDAAPIVENNRTFVPFRALAEAFGATVAYDEATQAVTAELNGVTVVMTIGSAEYTVNGEAKTADVAPFINGSRTMVPVRFAAEAFGIKVIPTYDENGATADILFNL